MQNMLEKRSKKTYKTVQKKIMYTPISNCPPLRYIDPKIGNDETGEGTHEKPFKTLDRALMTLPDHYGIVRWDSALIYCDGNLEQIRNS